MDLYGHLSLVREHETNWRCGNPPNGSTSTCNQKWQETQIIQFRNIFTEIWVHIHTYSLHGTTQVEVWSVLQLTHATQCGLYIRVALGSTGHPPCYRDTMLKGHYRHHTNIYDEDKPGYDKGKTNMTHAITFCGSTTLVNTYMVALKEEQVSAISWFLKLT